MRDARLWQRLVGMDGRRVVVEGVEFDEEAGAVVVHIRWQWTPPWRASRRVRPTERLIPPTNPTAGEGVTTLAIEQASFSEGG